MWTDGGGQRRTTELTVAMLQLVASGQGVAALPVQPYLQDFVNVTRETGFVTLKGAELLPLRLRRRCCASVYAGCWPVSSRNMACGFNLETAVGCACQCRDRCARQGVTTQRTPVRKEEQRRMARRARRWRVHSALTQ